MVTHKNASDDGAAGAGGYCLDEGAIATLEALYARLPALECKGLCGHSCNSHIDASHVERARIAAAGIDLDAPTPDGACPALSRALVSSGRCTVHPLRPMVCRLWGAATAMPCPHGCTPHGGPLDDRATLEAIAASLDAGGHHDAGLRAVLATCMSDPVAAALMAARLRGQRSVEPALATRLRALHQETTTKSR